MDMKASHSLSGTETGNPAYLVYEDVPLYDLWLKLILGGVLALTLIPGIALLSVDITGTWVMLGATAFDVLLFYAILPRRYQIFQDKVRIVLGQPFAFNISLSVIKEGRQASGSKAFAYRGIRFATSSRSVVEIVRHKGLNVVISPSDRDMFLEQLNQALKAMPD